MSSQVVTITQVGQYNTVAAQLQVGGVSYSAPITSIGIGSISNLTLDISNPSAPAWMTGDGMAFTSATGAPLVGVNGTLYCLANAAAAEVPFAVMAQGQLLSNALLLQPASAASFTLNTAATVAAPIVVSVGCSGQLTPLVPGPSPPPQPPGPAPVPLTPASNLPKQIVIGAAIAVGIFLLLFFLYLGIGTLKK